MTASLLLPLYVAIDGNGNPMSGALLCFYQTGTTTPQNTYTDAGLGTPNANPVVADSNGLFPPIYLSSGPDYKMILKTSAGVTVATRDPVESPTAAPTLPTLRSYLAGLTLSAAGSSASFGIAAGQCADSTNSALMSLASSMTKTTSAWSAGTSNGSLDTGTIANNTWYHTYLIQRTDTGAVDLLTSTSVSSPTMPSPYTLKRRIGSMKTDGSAQWKAFTQDGDGFWWVTPVSDINVNAPGTSAVLRTLSVPTGLNVEARYIIGLSNNSAATGSSVMTYDPANSGSTTFAEVGSVLSAASGVGVWRAKSYARTNTSAQVGTIVGISGGLGDANVTLSINTLGWIDRRGRDA